MSSILLLSAQFLWLVALLSPPPKHVLDWQQGTGFRHAALAVPVSGKPGFTLLSPDLTGVHFTNQVTVARYTTNQISLNGSGVAAGDVDADGRCDLYFCRSQGGNVLYRNLGNWKFEDITAAAGVACTNLNSTGTALADLDGDGDLDLVVNSVGTGTEIFLNDGKGHFTYSGSLNQLKGAMSLALGDIDGDGDLDLYIANYRTTTIRDQPGTQMVAGTNGLGQLVVRRVAGRPMTDPDLVGRFTLEPNGRLIEHGEADALYRNDGHGRFSPASFTDGTFLDEAGRPLRAPLYDWGLSVMFRDISGDGAPDIYVCNDFESEDRVWISIGGGRFRALPRLGLRHTSLFSMGVDFADVDRDGFLDFFVGDMLSRSHWMREVQTADATPGVLTIGAITDRPQYGRNTLQINRGDGSYAELAEFSGVEASEWSWSPIFLDVDLDGYEDLLITTGNERDERNTDVIDRAEMLKAGRSLTRTELLNLRKMFSRLELPNRAYRNRGDLTFEDKSAAWGFDQVGISQGMALADLDNDGDLDVVINNLNGVVSLCRNEAPGPRLAVRLNGLAPNTHGIGAKIQVHGGPVLQSQEMISGGRYLSSDDSMRVFAAGTASNLLRIEVTWRNGKRSVVDTALANQVYEIDEAAAGEKASPEKRPAKAQPVFEDISPILQHSHHEDSFDDLARQPLLPNRLSQLGPGVSCFDINSDGWDDLLIGSGKGGRLAVFLNDQKGGFAPLKVPPLTDIADDDETGILGWSDGRRTILSVGIANYENSRKPNSGVRLYGADGTLLEELPLANGSSVGALAIADIDGDGDLDLFLGGRSLPGRYPEAATSVLFKNESGHFAVSQRFDRAGLVSAAVFSDLDADGAPELILACEWGPIHVYHDEHGHYRETTDDLGFGASQGWWTGVTTADLDNDGRMDIVAGNWGLNHKFQTSPEHPRNLYYGQFGGSGAVDIIQAYYDEQMGKEVPERGLNEVSAALPFIREHFPTHEAYGKAGLEEILGDRLKAAHRVQVSVLESSVFFNRGPRFQRVSLPQQAQFAPVFGICVGDLDGDGNEDVFLSQNFFATHPTTSRNDAGRALWLKGDGTGALRPLSGQESGVRIYGEQRGCALADFDRDGRVDLVVSQNGNSTRLFRNTSAHPGLLVRLNGGPGNPQGIGAVVRVKRGGRFGPAREVHAGSGYWSQDSAVQVLAAAEGDSQLWVRWPGGKVSTFDLAAGAHEVELSVAGAAKVLR